MWSAHLGQQQSMFHHAVHNENMWQHTILYGKIGILPVQYHDMLVTASQCQVDPLERCLTKLCNLGRQMHASKHACAMKSVLEKRRGDVLYSSPWKPSSPPVCKHRAEMSLSTQCIHWSFYHWMNMNRSNHCQFCSQQEASQHWWLHSAP